MDNNHPIQPSSELVERCKKMFKLGAPMEHMCRVVAQWGADQELDACCEWLEINYDTPRASHPLRTIRRPKPLSLKEQAIVALHAVATGANDTREQQQDLDTIRTALEALPDD